MLYKLLVNAPCGDQRIEYVSETGHYFDESRVLWDERADGELPDNIEYGKMIRQGNKLIKAGAFILEYSQMKQMKDLEKINKKISDLWKAADSYISTEISGVGLAILATGVYSQKPKAIAVANWCDSIWSEYYARKSQVNATTNINTDFSMFGAKPYTVLELREEVANLWITTP